MVEDFLDRKYDIARIVKERTAARSRGTRNTLLLVAWADSKGGELRHKTWEPLSTLLQDVPEMVEEFYEHKRQEETDGGCQGQQEGPSAVDALVEELKAIKVHGQSRFCDVCGYAHPDVKCCSCTSSFHKACMWEDELQVPDGWTCHACKRRELELSSNQGRSKAQEAADITAVARRAWIPPAGAKACCSCGYLEAEAIKCKVCERWFCFGCMCLSAATVPAKVWRCSDCVGQEDYDRVQCTLIEASRTRVETGTATAQECDGFSQLVFDLLCSCHWDEWERNMPTLVRHARKQLGEGKVPAVMPFHSLHYGTTETGVDQEMVRDIAKAYATHAKKEAYRRARVARKVCKRGGEEHEGEQVRSWRHERLGFAPSDQRRRLRIGYLSADFVDHPTADLIQSALIKHNAKRFEIFCYSISRDDDCSYRRTLRTQVEHFTHFPSCSKTHSDKQCAELIAADGIHVLVNLNGHTADNRNGICALRPAPVQVLYLGYPGTLGGDYMDYNVVDEVVCPAEHREFYTERLLYMPHCYQANSFAELYADILDPATLPRRADHQLPDQPTVVLCNFCRLGRITRPLFAVWMRILRRVPTSVLWLYSHPRAAVGRLQATARQMGVSPERLIFAPPCSPKLEHLKRVTLADLALDTLVYNGHTTASDMLWAGVPLITMRGDTWPSRVAASVAEAALMRELVVDDLKAYEDKAVALAQTPERLRQLKEELAEKRTSAPLFDSGLWVRNFELGLDEVWRRYAAGATDAAHVLVKHLDPALTTVPRPSLTVPPAAAAPAGTSAGRARAARRGGPTSSMRGSTGSAGSAGGSAS